MKEDPKEIADLLKAWKTGDNEAFEQLFSFVYEALHGLAKNYFRGEYGNTLQPTALVHEAYLRLVDQKRADCKNRGQFFAVAGLVMRRILVDHARRRAAERRGGELTKVVLDEERDAPTQVAYEIIEVDEALDRLWRMDPRQGKIVELRFFAGLNVEEIGQALKISTPTVKRDWAMAKAWLFRQLKGESI